MNIKNIFSSSINLFQLDIATFILRLLAGGFMLFGHGYPKFNSFLKGNGFIEDTIFGLGSDVMMGLVLFSEGFCAILITIGLLTRYASISLIITMSYALFIYHAGESLADKEKVLMYLTLFILVFILGSGKYSIDRLIKPRKSTL